MRSGLAYDHCDKTQRSLEDHRLPGHGSNIDRVRVHHDADDALVRAGIRIGAWPIDDVDHRVSDGVFSARSNRSPIQRTHGTAMLLPIAR